MLGNNRRIAILKKISELCKNKSHPFFTQANIRRRAHEKGWPENQMTKSTLSKYFADPEKSYENVPLLFYDVMLDMLNEEEISIPVSHEEDRLSADDFSIVLPMFMDIGPHDEKTARGSLPGDYWSYMPSIERPGAIIKALLRIREQRNGTLSAEELYYYRKPGFVDYVKQKSKGTIASKGDHCLMVLNDPSSKVPKVYILRTTAGTSNQCMKLSGGTMMVSSDTEAVKIMQRKIICIRAKEEVPNRKKHLIEECGMGIHTKDTDDEIIKGLFEVIKPNQQGLGFYI